MAIPSLEDRCSLRSRAADEPLAGTASTIRFWLLVEHAGPWGRDGLLDARLPEGVGRDLRALERRSGARILLIRRPGSGSAAGVACVAVDTAEARMERVTVERIEDVPALDPRRPDGAEPVPGPLFVVCTHGRRDVCCAERGRPLRQAVARAFPGACWESTHVGGDRFAGNLVAFPHGLYFGRVEPEEAAGIAEAYASGRITRLDRYRGRSSHAFFVQAAEVAVRTALRLDGIEALALGRRRREADRAEVVFGTPLGARLVRLERTLGTPMRLTCQSAGEEAPQVWRAVDVVPFVP